MWRVFLQSRQGGRQGGLALLQPGRLYMRRIWRCTTPPLHSLSCSPPYNHPSQQPKNLRAALNPLSVLRHCEMCACLSRRQAPKGVFVLRLVDEVQSVFWAKQAHPLTWGRTLTLTGLQTKITPSCLLCFPLNPLQHMTCVTATDLHWKIRTVQGQGKSPKQRKEREKSPIPSFSTLMDYLKSSFFLNT